MTNEVLTWEITPSEKREQVKNFISKTWLVLVGLVVFSLFYYVSGFFSWMLFEEIKPVIFRVVYVAIGVAIFVGLFFILNKFILYRLRTYRLDNTGITISKGKKKKCFSWNEFEYFYAYRSYQSYPNQSHQSYLDHFRESMRGQLLETGQQIEGQIFYFKKKSTGFFLNCAEFLSLSIRKPIIQKKYRNF